MHREYEFPILTVSLIGMLLAIIICFYKNCGFKFYYQLTCDPGWLTTLKVKNLAIL